MANKKISDLAAATSMDGSEYLEAVQGGVNKKVPANILGTGLLKARAYLSSGSATTSSAAWGKVPIETASFDPDSIFDTTNDRFIPTIAGYYLFNGRFSVTSQTELMASLAKNGTVTSLLGSRTGTYGKAAGGSDLIYCNGSTDYLELYAYTAASKTLENGANTWMSILGPF